MHQNNFYIIVKCYGTQYNIAFKALTLNIQVFPIPRAL